MRKRSGRISAPDALANPCCSSHFHYTLAIPICCYLIERTTLNRYGIPQLKMLKN